MDSSTEELLLQKIEELVFDEDKIVTNSVVCEKFDVSLRESKYILKKYISDDNLYPGKISVTYLICGKLKTGEYNIQIVDSIELYEKKKSFSLISDEVVYSVQKSNSIDFNAISISEKIASTFQVPKGSIIGEKCSERLVKSKVLPPPPAQKNFEKPKSSMFFKPVPKTEANCEKKQNQSTSTNNSKINTQKKPGGLAGFLSQTPQNSNHENKHQHKLSSSDEEPRVTKRPRMESNDQEADKVEVKVENEPESSEVINDKSKEAVPKNEVPEENSNGKTSDAKQPSKKASNKKKQEGKKRKRIILQSDSEDDLFANDEDEKLNVDSEEEKPLIAEPKETIPKNKRRKAVEKVYTDDEGFVVTKTEYVLVSASEDEETEVEAEKPKVVKPQEKEEKKSPPQKPTAKGKKGKALAGNQPTLMSFFKKK
ncbi:nucleolar protein dao-5-like [Coccinella septempunctata]|uniref:nucleolar protein dao-5-like n=1 Tax=Coccinella septempunctata TaxID=41139 RepID=UPI001D082F0C|nr:nucleolar protein dao-5-like [Coccinella septempunctata]